MVPIHTEGDWEKMMEDHYKIICLDVHADWCGPCTVMQFFWDKLVRESEIEPSFLIIFLRSLAIRYTLSLMSLCISPSVPCPLPCLKMLDLDRCDERVAWWSVNQEKMPELVKSILPPWSKVNIYTKGCCPLFLFIQYNPEMKQMEMVAEVIGCDSPQCIREIKEYLPPVPETPRSP